MRAEFDVQLKTKELFAFQMYNTYRRLTGIIWVLFSLICVGVVVYTWGNVQLYQSILLIILASLYTVINPIMLWFKTVKQMKKNEGLRKPLHYVVTQEGITVSQEDASETTPWTNMWKAVRCGNLIFVYITNMRIFNLPIRCLDDQYDSFISLAKDGLGSHCKL